MIFISQVARNGYQEQNKVLLILFYRYIYPPDSQESDGGVVHRAGSFPNLPLEMPKYCCPLEIFYFFCFYTEITEIETAAKQGNVKWETPPAGECAVKCLSQGATEWLE